MLGEVLERVRDMQKSFTQVMDQTADSVSSSGAAVERRRDGFSGMVLADLQKLAIQLGIKDVEHIPKSQLIFTIKEYQSDQQLPSL